MAKIRNITLSRCTPEFGSIETLIYCIEHWNAINHDRSCKEQHEFIIKERLKN